MRYVLLGAAILWTASTVYFLITWEWSPDRSVEWAAMVISIGGFVVGLLGALFVLVAAIWSGHQEKKQWE
jgi:hypothetical protein